MIRRPTAICASPAATLPLTPPDAITLDYCSMRIHPTTRASLRGLRARWRALRVRRLQRRTAGHKLLRAFAKAYPRARFIEVGAGDGQAADHLRPFILSERWSGILVEPVPYVFDRLRRRYAGVDRIVLENVAIADRVGTVPVYHFAELDDPYREGVPDWYHLLGSLSRDVLLRHSYIPDHERRIVSTEVPCIDLSSLCRKHRIERLDLVAIDTEGHDYEIVKQIDFATYHPRLIVYEHSHLSTADRTRCRALLQGLGYELMEEYMDTWCLDVEPDDPLTGAWRGLTPTLQSVYGADSFVK